MNNLNKKTIIQIVVIILAFSGSGFLVYNSMFKKAPKPVVAQLANTTTEKILPYGDTMDFKGVLNKQSFNFGVVTYPKLDPGQEVGIPEESLIMFPPQTLTP